MPDFPDFSFSFDDESQMVKPGSDEEGRRLKDKADAVRRASAETRTQAHELAELIRKIHAEGAGNRNWIATVTGLTVPQTQAALDNKEIFEG